MCFLCFLTNQFGMLGSQFPVMVLYENSGVHAFNSANNFDSIAFLSLPWQQIILLALLFV